jgi:hypothetical protein
MGRRRRTLSRLPTKPKLTPIAIYVLLALLCVGGLFFSKQNLVKTINGKVLDAYSGQPLGGVTLVLTNDRQQARTAGIVQTGSFNFPRPPKVTLLPLKIIITALSRPANPG